MPLMDGYDVLNEIRKNPDNSDLPIIVITGHDERDERNEILRKGATNLISKPIDKSILINRITTLIERKILIDQLSQFHDRISAELSHATSMQRSLIPNKYEMRQAEKKYCIKLSSHFRPSSELGGDAWFSQHISGTCFGVILIDFSGHGISAALNTFRFQTIINKMGPCQNSPAKYIREINRELSQVLPVGQFCTMLYAKIDFIKNTLTYSGASAPSPIYGYFSEKQNQLGDGSGLPLGINADADYEDHVINFPEGSYFFLYSDALYETKCQDGKTLEIHGVNALVKKHLNLDAKKTLDTIILGFDELTEPNLSDDLTAVWISR